MHIFKFHFTLVPLFLLVVLLQPVGTAAGTLGSLYGTYQRFKDFEDQLGGLLDSAPYGLAALDYCEASGSRNCPLTATLCGAFKLFEPFLSVHFVASQYIEVTIDHFCLGEPTLKCCRKKSGGACWSAFNTEAPINCEGNPGYGPTYTAGLCLRPCPGCAGCLCNYLSECASNAGPRFDASRMGSEGEPDRQTWFQIGRMANFYASVSATLRGLALSTDNRSTATAATNRDKYGTASSQVSASSQLLDFVSYRGCVGFLDNALLLARAVPSFNLTTFRGHVIERTDDLFDEMIPSRASLPYFVAARLGADIPDFWLKVNNFSATPWDADRRVRALSDAGVDDPESQVLKYVDLGGLYILRATLGPNWVLMAVPVQQSGGSSQQRSTSGALSRCREGDGRGSPVRIRSFDATVDGDVVTISVTISDPLSSGEVLSRVSWGDSSQFEDFVLEDGSGDNRAFTASHTYTQCMPPPQVTIQLVNKSGLVTLIKKTVEPICSGSATELSSSPSLDGYPPVVSVKLTLEVSKAGSTFGSSGSQAYYFQGAPSQAEDLERDELVTPHAGVFRSLGVTRANAETEPISVVFSLNSQSLTSLEYLRFTCRTFDHYVYSSASAKVTSVQLRLLSGVVVDDVPFESVTHGDGSGLFCSRRGNVFEDEQDFFVIRVGPAGDGIARLGDDMNRESVEELTADGFYEEVLPGSFTHKRTLDDLGGDTSCVDDNNVGIKVYTRDVLSKTDCAGLGSRQKKIRRWYCRRIKEAKKRCKATCDRCRTGMASLCTDSSDTDILPVFKEETRNCLWLMGRDEDTINTNCRSRKVGQSCPKTCGKC